MYSAATKKFYADLYKEALLKLSAASCPQKAYGKLRQQKKKKVQDEKTS